VKEKENKKSRWRGLLRGESWWAARPQGRKGEEVSFLFFFFFKLFSNQTYKLKFKPSFFKLFQAFSNTCPFSYGIKGDFIPELTINAQRP
jgi:hypothetical protein